MSKYKTKQKKKSKIGNKYKKNRKQNSRKYFLGCRGIFHGTTLSGHLENLAKGQRDSAVSSSLNISIAGMCSGSFMAKSNNKQSACISHLA